MVGRIVGLVCCLLCAFPFLVIGFIIETALSRLISGVEIPR